MAVITAIIAVAVVGAATVLVLNAVGILPRRAKAVAYSAVAVGRTRKTDTVADTTINKLGESGENRSLFKMDRAGTS